MNNHSVCFAIGRLVFIELFNKNGVAVLTSGCDPRPFLNILNTSSLVNVPLSFWIVVDCLWKLWCSYRIYIFFRLSLSLKTNVNRKKKTHKYVAPAEKTLVSCFQISYKLINFNKLILFFFICFILVTKWRQFNAILFNNSDVIYFFNFFFKSLMICNYNKDICIISIYPFDLKKRLIAPFIQIGLVFNYVSIAVVLFNLKKLHLSLFNVLIEYQETNCPSVYGFLCWWISYKSIVLSITINETGHKYGDSECLKCIQLPLENLLISFYMIASKYCSLFLEKPTLYFKVVWNTCRY